MKNLSLLAWLCILACLSFSSKAVDCSIDTIGLCTPTIEEIIEESVTEEIEYCSDGITITTTTETTTTTSITSTTTTSTTTTGVQSLSISVASKFTTHDYVALLNSALQYISVN